MITRLAVFLLAAVSALFAQGHPPPVEPSPESPFALDYDRPEMWLCRPDLPTDICRGNLDATDLRPDGSGVVVPFVAKAKPAVDCFYVYPTVDSSFMPGNHTDFSDTALMRDVTQFEIARFESVCRVVVPLYRQVTITTYLLPSEQRDMQLAIAYSDVASAFRWYRAHLDIGLPLVLVGHSQGAAMVLHLLRAFFDQDAGMRSRLLVAMAVGIGMQVPEGSVMGAGLHHIPLCTSADQLACVIAFNTFRPEGTPYPWIGLPPPGRRTACVNPADAEGRGKHMLSAAVFPTRSRVAGDLAASKWATTPFLELRDFYEAWCADGHDGFHYLAVEAAPSPSDVRESPVDLESPMWRTLLGLHMLDFQFTEGDLVRLVKRKAAAAAHRRR